MVLIITIIVLLILASISIASLNNGNNIINKTQKVTYDFGAQVAFEYLNLSKVELQTKKQSTNIQLDEYLEFLKNDGRTEILNQVDEKSAYVKVDGKYIFLIEEDGSDIKITFQESYDEDDVEIDSAKGIIEFQNLIWNNGQASVTIIKNTNDNLKIEYQVVDENMVEITEYRLIESGNIINSLNSGETIYARLTDGVNYGESTSLKIIDSVKPTVIVNQSTITTTSIEVNVSATDSQTGIASDAEYNYYIKENTSQEYSEPISSKNKNYKFENLTPDVTYDIKVTVYDRAGNLGEGTLLGISTGHEHKFGEWIVTKNATCTENGEETRECACGEKETRTINSIGHNYSVTEVEPSFEGKGYYKYTCANCGDTYTVDSNKTLELCGSNYKKSQWSSAFVNTTSSYFLESGFGGALSSKITPSLCVSYTGNYGSAYTKEKINLTDAKSITFTYKQYDNLYSTSTLLGIKVKEQKGINTTYVGIANEQANNTTFVSKSKTTYTRSSDSDSVKEYTKKIDVSSLSGYYYIKMYVSHTYSGDEITTSNTAYTGFTSIKITY